MKQPPLADRLSRHARLGRNRVPLAAFQTDFVIPGGSTDVLRQARCWAAQANHLGPDAMSEFEPGSLDSIQLALDTLAQEDNEICGES